MRSPACRARGRVATALAAAQEDALGAEPVPAHLRDASYGGARALGHGQGYIYPHDEPDAVSDQPLAPEALREERFYEPADRGFEAELRQRLERLRQLFGKR